jgi:DNA-directed RNA polymerase subunit RPC12/RpoP
MAGDTGLTTEIACPHCRKTFTPRLLAGAAQRHRGYKCPHCKLFVPEGRAEDAPLARDHDA